MRVLLLIGVLIAAAGCAHAASARLPTPPSCHAAEVLAPGPAEASARVSLDAIAWRDPDPSVHDREQAGWCDGVGPAAIVRGGDSEASDSLVVVSWNMHVGGGDLPALLDSVERQFHVRGRPRPAIVLLLQEAVREGDSVPVFLKGMHSARRIGRGEMEPSRDILRLARDLGLWAAYVPSMRNGRDGLQDRGNAILSSVPLDSIEAIELPDSRQRRVAVAADVRGRTSDGTPWRVRVATVHLESRTGARRLWMFAGGVRASQARVVAHAIGPSRAAILGGDFNSWAGFDEAAYRELAPLFPDTRVTDPRPTFAFRRRLDHLLFRLPAGWHARFERLDSRFGSDHHPLAGVVRIALDHRKRGQSPFSGATGENGDCPLFRATVNREPSTQHPPPRTVNCEP